MAENEENEKQGAGRKPGQLVPWEEKRKDHPQIQGDEALLREVWERLDALANRFIWFCLIDM